MRLRSAMGLVLILILSANTVVGVDALKATEIYRHPEKSLEVSDEAMKMNIFGGMSVSPDGGQILFSMSTIEISLLEDNSILTSKIYALDVDRGTYDFISDGEYPCWSPEGDEFVYISTGKNVEMYTDEATGELISFDKNVYIMDENSGVRQVTNDSRIKLTPAWSPDGEKIAYAAESFGIRYIYVMDANGTNSTKLTDKGLDPVENPVWSPDGSKIAFYSNSTGNGEIFVINSDGTGLIQLTDNSVANFPAAWSSDGKKILFSEGESLRIMNPDGTENELLIRTVSMPVGVDFSPDDKLVYYTDTASTVQGYGIINKLEISGWS